MPSKTNMPKKKTTQTNKTPKKPTKKTIKKIATKDNSDDYDTKMDQILDALRDNYTQQKKLMADLKDLKKVHKKEIKLANKTDRRVNSGKCSGFNKPSPVPEPLRKLLDLDNTPISRSAVTKLLYQYFTDNKMKNKRDIIPNSKVRRVFGMKETDKMDFYNLQKWVKKVYQENQIDDNSTVLILND